MKKIVIETGDKRQKERMGKYKSWQDLEKKRIKALNNNKAGWKVLYIWEDEFDQNPNKILSKIKILLN